MNDLIKVADSSYNFYDNIQVIISQLYSHEFFPWTCLVLIISHNNIKRPIILLMVLHWALRCIGDIFVNTLDLYPKDYPSYWPFSNLGWSNSYGIASIFWYSSEIIGDWYLVLRTKALIRNNQKLKWVLILCIIYNIIKVIQMIVYPTNVPFENVSPYDPNNELESNYQYLRNLANHKLKKWTTVILQQFGSIAFDISVIITLKKYFFNKKSNTHIYSNNRNGNNIENNFFQKFKHLSEYRIYLSIFVTIAGFPFLLAFCLGILYTIKLYHGIENKQETVDFFGVMCDDQGIDKIRVFVLNFSYFFMYIDQILLRYYVEENNITVKSSSNNTSSANNHSISTPNTDYSVVYRKFDGDDDDNDHDHFEYYNHNNNISNINNYNNINNNNINNINNNNYIMSYDVTPKLGQNNSTLSRRYDDYDNYNNNNKNNNNNNKYKMVDYDISHKYDKSQHHHHRSHSSFGKYEDFNQKKYNKNNKSKLMDYDISDRSNNTSNSNDLTFIDVNPYAKLKKNPYNSNYYQSSFI
ncbi:hypothetical protein BCR32DRAFT_284258 [Anaeromyces robustus]|uniref:Uncharacterized protein n=1 Tax=Anaeromyces robustus TaxID=1754192 RepID=A0A1Y1WS42_9FUNG|nr:hypothetical protein BCR32DRAFT_284258 [Anaeromyces robustus]|eukprot:ORX76363.1 hypothetical protein BCR32DRAFT_284258 [Anaeromyces robustus]